MGKTNQQAAAPQTTFKDANDAYDQISPFLTAQFQFRDTGINQACNQLREFDQPSLGAQILKSGLKIGLAAAAGAVGGATAGLGLVALGAIGLGFGIGGELVDGVFAGAQAPAGIEEFRTKRLNVLHSMQAKETARLKKLLNGGDQEAWGKALGDYANMQQNVSLQNLEIDSTVDGWMNGVNSNTNGTGGTLGEGSEELDSITTGRLHIDGTVTPGNSGPVVRVTGATLDGLETAALRNRYLDRKLSDIGIWCQFAFPLNFELGALGFRASESQFLIDGGDNFKSALGRMSVNGAAMTAPGYDWSKDVCEGAEKVKNALGGKKLRDFGIAEVAAGGMFE